MAVDVDVLRSEAQRLRDEWDAGAWLPDRTTPPKSNPGAVADRCLALIRAFERAKTLASEIACMADTPNHDHELCHQIAASIIKEAE